MSSLGQARCYYCTQSIPAEALNCPSCGKERKELNDLKIKGTVFAIASIAIILITLLMYFRGLKYRWSDIWGNADLSITLSDPLFWFLTFLLILGMSLVIPCLSFLRRYQKMTGTIKG